MAADRDQACDTVDSLGTRIREVLDATGDAFVAMDDQGRVTGWNTGAEVMYGWSRAEAFGRYVADLIIPPAYRADHNAGVARFLATGAPRVLGKRIELEGMRRDGTVFPIEISFWATAIDGVWNFYSFSQDITARKARESRLAYLASHDELTGLANRRMMLEELTDALAAARVGGEYAPAVLYCDLDRFKTINDSFGHAAGDELLKAVADRLRDATRPGDLAARISGDEFAVVCRDVHQRDEAAAIGQRILTQLCTPVRLVEDEVTVSASIGVALGGSDSAAEELLRDADAAMYRAKQSGRGRLMVFDTDMRRHLQNRLRTELDLTVSVDRDQMRLHYQPIVDAVSGKPVGVEALARWQHPTRGLLLPAEFIPLAEETGVIIQIGDWVLREACRQARQWRDIAALPPFVAVNLSARQISQTCFAGRVRAALNDAGLDPTDVGIELEVTESLLMKDPSGTIDTLTELHDMGIKLSIDDFGTGYSALAYLKDFPVDTVKIDRSFVMHVDTDPRQRALVAAIIDLGHVLGLTVLAEGAETTAQVDRLVELGCDQIQGFYFGRPQPAHTFAWH